MYHSKILQKERQKRISNAINELKPNGNKVRTVKYPSGNVYTKVTNPFGDVIEYSVNYINVEDAKDSSYKNRIEK